MEKTRTAVRSGWGTLVALVMLVALASFALSACDDESGTTSSSPAPSASASESAGAGESGLLLWKFKAGGGIASSPAIADGVVYVGSEDGYLYAVDIQSGQERWKFLTGGPIAYSPGPTGSSLAIAGGAVYCRSSDGYLYAVDLRSGQQRWRFKVSSASGYGASPAVAGGAVYAASDQGRLYALDGRTGQKIWTVKIDSEYSPAASGRMVYLGTRRGLQALDAATGKRLWTYRPWGQGVSSTPVVSHGMVYGRTAGWIAAVWAVDAQRGRDWWSLPADSPASSSPAVSGGVIYYTGNPLGGKYWLHAVDAQSGKDMWHSEAGSDEGISPAASSGVVCVTGFKTLYAVDARTGGERWQFETGGSISSSPAISNGVVYVGSDDGYLYAVGARPAVSYDESPEAGPYRHMLPSTGSVGWSFKPTVDIEVTELGCFSPERVGLKDAHRVGIFDAKTERLLASVTVRPQSTFEGFFRWEPLETPLVLKARHSYLVGTGTRGDETLYEEDLPSEQWAPEVAFGELLTSHGRSGGAFMAPTDPTYGANWDKIVWMSPNFKFVPVSVQPASTVLTD